MLAAPPVGCSVALRAASQLVPFQVLSLLVVVLKMVRPAAGLAMASRWTVVIRGGSRPLVVLLTSRTAEAAGVPAVLLRLSGRGWALLAPLSGVVPTMGAAYIARAFITVITGGASILAGTVSASALLGSVSTVGTFLSTPVLGEVAMLGVAVVLLRLLPRGITGRIMRRAL